MHRIIYCSILLALTVISCKKATTNAPVPAAGIELDYVEVEEHLFGAHLYLYGNFGDSTATGKVKIGNTLVDIHARAEGVILSWKPYLIKLEIGDPDDEAGSGYVSVLNNGKETNQRLLNVWTVNMLYQEPDEGTIEKEVQFTALLRADAGAHKNIVTLQRPGTFSAMSQALWKIGGQGHAAYTGGGNTITLENRSGAVIWSKPYEDHANEENNFQSEVRFTANAFLITALRMHKLDATNISNQADGSPVPFITSYDLRAEVIPMNDSLLLELDNSKAIKAGQYITGPHGTQYDFTWDASEAPNHMHEYTLQWQKANPRYAQ